MDSLKEYLFSKYFSHFGYVVAALHVPALVVFATVTGQLRTSERRTFRCDVSDCRDDCLKKYDKHYSSPLPLYAFVLLCFVPSLAVCIAYSWCCVKSRVDEIEAAMKPDPENPRPRPRVKTHRVFCCYFLHLFVRFFLGISFAVFQNSVFYASNTLYASDFPTEFACYICDSTAILKPTANSTNLNFINIEPSAINCDNSVGSDNATWAKGIWIVNILFAFLVFVELCYLLVRALKSNTFIFDSEFCLKHFFNKRRTPVTLRDSIFRLRRRVRKDTEYLEPLIASGGENNDNKALDAIFVDLVIFTGRAAHRFHNSLKRHEIYDSYLKPKQGAVPIKKLAELFLPNKDTKDPRRILIVGRPGIGKSLLCKKISRDWSKDELLLADSMKTFEHFFLFQFRWFNSGTEEERKISLKQLLSLVYPDKQIDDEMFQDILDSPERVLLVFDGLDEFKHHDSCLEDEQAQGGNGPREEMHFSALYIKLVKGKQLPGATVVTTCRPNVVQSVASLTFDRRVEIMGFTPEKVEEYVHKFCAQNTKIINRIWQHLSSNLELLSLCYIPVNSFIICSLLEKWITLSLDEQDSESTLPTTTTEVYTGALRLFIFKHHPEFKGKTLTNDYLMGNAAFSDSIEETLSQLGSLAKAGIEARKLIFGSTEVQGMENCGLLNRLPDGEVSPYCFAAHFCFIHLTIQELLAAREIAKMLPSYLGTFISSNASDPKWQLVIQFVAGLLRGKENEAVNTFVSHLHDALTAAADRRENNLTKQMALLMLKCLYEYSDETVVRKAVSELHKNSKFDNEIDLSDCQVSSIECKAITYFVKYLIEVTVLNLSGNSITDQTALNLCQTLTLENCKLTQLNLSHNSLTDQAVLNLCGALKHKNCNLAQLNLSYNRITDQAVLHLCGALKQENCKLTQLNLCINPITDQAVLHLCGALQHENCQLTQLNLSYNRITDQAVLHLCGALKKENCKLTQLNLSYNSITDQAILHLCEALEHENCKLTQLDLLRVYSITDRAVLHLCGALQHENCKLTQLNLSYNRITDQAVLHLCGALKQENCKLTQLNLSYNSITDQAVLHLCRALKHKNSKLTQLDLSYNSITDQAVLHLSGALKHENCKLTQLELLRVYSITDQAILHLSGALQHENCKLTQLNLSHNSITDQAVLHLCGALKHKNCKLTQLDLSYNTIIDQAVLHLCGALKHKNCKLTQLNLSYNSITEQDKRHLVDAAQINTQCEVMV